MSNLVKVELLNRWQMPCLRPLKGAQTPKVASGARFCLGQLCLLTSQRAIEIDHLGKRKSKLEPLIF